MAKKQESKELQKQEKQEVTTPEGVERMTTRRIYAPKVDIMETNNTISVIADIPGVNEKDVEIMLEKNVLTIKAHVDFTPPEGYDLAYREYAIGDYERAFTLSDEVDRNKIEAKIKDGVLRLTIPKLAPDNRQISVKAG